MEKKSILDYSNLSKLILHI